MKRTRLSDGIYLTVLESDKFKTDYFDFNIILPLRAETASAAALLPMVLKRGCEAYPTMAEIKKRLDYLYATGFYTQVYKRGESQILAFRLDFLRENLLPAGETLADDVFELLRGILFRPVLEDGAFKKEYVETEKKNLCDDIEALINNKNAYAVRKCHEIMCEGEAFAVNENGDVDAVKAITPASLYAFYRELLSGARFELFYTGKCDENAMRARVTALLSGVERQTQSHAFALGTVPFVRKHADVRRVTEDVSAVQGKLAMGFRTGYTVNGGNYSAFALFNELYGGSPTSKLFENVREKMSLCYYCSSAPEMHKGILTVASGIEVKNREKAEAEILAQLKNVRDGIVSEEELSSAKKSLINHYREFYDEAQSLSVFYLSRFLGGSEKTLEQVIAEVEAVTKEEITACAANVELDTVFFLKGTKTDTEVPHNE